MIPREPSHRFLEEGRGRPFEALLNPLGTLPPKRVSGCFLQHQHFLQVVAHSFKPEMIVVAHSSKITASLQPIAAFQGADDPLHGPAHSRQEFIPFLLLGRNGSITPRPVDDTAENPPAPQRLLAGIFGIGSIGKHCGLIADDHILKQMRLRNIGCGQSQTSEQAAPLIDTEMDFIAKMPVFASAGPIRLRIWTGLSFARRMGLGFDQSSVKSRNHAAQSYPWHRAVPPTGQRGVLPTPPGPTYCEIGKSWFRPEPGQ